IEASGPIRPDAPPAVPALPARTRALVAPPIPPLPEARLADPSAPHWSLPGQLFDRVFGGPAGTAPGVTGWRHTPEQPPHPTHRHQAPPAKRLISREAGDDGRWNDPAGSVARFGDQLFDRREGGRSQGRQFARAEAEPLVVAPVLRALVEAFLERRDSFVLEL